MTSGKLTIKDIAKQSGYSISTVSRAINNHPDINSQTRRDIMELIEETGFIPNDSARFLKRTASNSIAIMVKGITNPFFSGMIHYIENYIQELSYTTILRHVASEEDEVLVAMSLVKERKLKGIVFLGGAFIHDMEQLDKLGVPYVFSTIGNLDGRVESAEKVANVAVDDVDAAMQAVDYLISLGHKKIGIISEGLQLASVGQLRWKGYLKSLEKAGIAMDPKLIYEANEGLEHYTVQNGYKGARTLLDNNPEMSALFCISDVLAMGACRALIDAGKKIPEDIAVVGFDGIDMGDYFIPRLTTIKQPQEKLAKATMSLLFDMINKKNGPQNLLYPAQLIIKESTESRKNK